VTILKIIVISMAALLTGCAGLDRAVCWGNGTCDRDLTASYSGPAAPSGFKGAVIVTNSGNYVLTPNATGSLPSAVIRSGR
jgi:hypothetical protein